MVKSEVFSLDVNVTVSVASLVADPLEIEDAMVMVGPELSYIQLNWLAAVLLLPAISVNFAEFTSIYVAPSPEGMNLAV